MIFIFTRGMPGNLVVGTSRENMKAGNAMKLLPELVMFLIIIIANSAKAEYCTNFLC